MLGPVRPQLARLVPALGDVESGIEEPLATSRMEEGVLAILGRLSAERPTLLIFEDVHWIDRASRDLVTFLARNLAAEPMLLSSPRGVRTWEPRRTDGSPSSPGSPAWSGWTSDGWTATPCVRAVGDPRLRS